MENNTIQVAAAEVSATKKCKCCGKVLPIEEFSIRGTGHRNTCNTCLRSNSGVSERFKDVMSRALIEELKARGYKGTLTKVITSTVKL